MESPLSVTTVRWVHCCQKNKAGGELRPLLCSSKNEDSSHSFFLGWYEGLAVLGGACCPLQLLSLSTPQP